MTGILFRKKVKMDYAKEFKKYYEGFMGYYQREIPINCEYHYIIISNIVKSKEKKISISPLFEIDENTKDTIYSISDLETLFLKLSQRYNYKSDVKVKAMLRMTLNKSYSTIKHSEKVNSKLAKLRKKYTSDLKFMEMNNKFILMNTTDILAHCRITNMDYNGANIQVWTNKPYRNNGCATFLLDEILKYCEKLNVLPIFLIDRQNKKAFKLAKNLGLEIYSKEIIVSNN
jgi:RimJ/RimL family protein N-acetyltransferase